MIEVYARDTIHNSTMCSITEHQFKKILEAINAANAEIIKRQKVK